METMIVKIEDQLKKEILQDLELKETLAMDVKLPDPNRPKAGLSTSQMWDLRRKRRARRSVLRRVL